MPWHGLVKQPTTSLAYPWSPFYPCLNEIAHLLSSDPIHVLRQEFRGHLTQFYAHLGLAPPYHSIEKAVQYLSNTLRTKTENFQQELLQNPTQKWIIFQECFSGSGLPKKHRGIIRKLALSSAYSASTTESFRFLKNFVDVPQLPHV